MNSQLTSAQLGQLRRDAKRLSRAESIPLSAAQDRLAKAAGARNWSLLAKGTPRKLASGRTRVVPRHYLHGDEQEGTSGQYFCAECDLFAPAVHFDEPHRVLHGQRALDAIERLVNRSGRSGGDGRPQGGSNLHAAAIAEEKRARAAREASRSHFHRWLERQVKRDDPIGDLATDVMRDGRFPVEASTFLQVRRYFAHRYVGQHVIDALKDAWREFAASASGADAPISQKQAS